MWFMFRAGRMIGRTAGPAKARPRYVPGPGEHKAAAVFWLIVITATCGHWWWPMYMVAGAVLLLGLGALDTGKSAAGCDQLTEAMREYGKGGRP